MEKEIDMLELVQKIDKLIQNRNVKFEILYLPQIEQFKLLHDRRAEVMGMITRENSSFCIVIEKQYWEQLLNNNTGICHPCFRLSFWEFKENKLFRDVEYKICEEVDYLNYNNERLVEISMIIEKWRKDVQENVCWEKWLDST